MKNIELFNISNYPGRYYLDLVGFYDSISYKKLAEIVRVAGNPGRNVIVGLRNIEW